LERRSSCRRSYRRFEIMLNERSDALRAIRDDDNGTS
jgi:hypothetical protein